MRVPAPHRPEHALLRPDAFLHQCGVMFLADRFLEEAGRVLDVATGEPVSLRVLAPSASPVEERAWITRCDQLVELWHECLPPLVDFGTLADGGRFEAYAPLPWRHTRDASESAALLAFLGTCGVSVSPPPALSAATWNGGRPLVGMRLAPPPALPALGDVLKHARHGAPVCLRCAAPPGSGWTTYLCMCAREARRSGFVPVDAGLLRTREELRSALRHRHVLLVESTGQTDVAERLLLRLAVWSARGHVLLARVTDEDRPVHLRLAPWSTGALARVAHLWPAAAAAARVARAAAQCGGRPGTFVKRLQGNRGRQDLSRVAEPRAKYLAPARIVPALVSAAAGIDGYVEEARRSATRLAGRGRHAAANRTLAQAAAGLLRRGEPVAAARVEIVRGWLLVSRGRSSDAQRTFRDAHAALDAAGDRAGVEAACGLAEALMADGSFEAAEAMLRAAVACTTGRPGGNAPDVRQERAPALALARCLYWQGRLDAAEQALAGALNADDGEARTLALGVLGRIALARHDLPNAGRAAALALAEPPDRVPAAAASVAHEVLLAAHARLADAPAVARHGVEALSAAKRARRPLRVLHVRAAILAARQACGERPNRRLLARLGGIVERVPPLSRARVSDVLARVHPDGRERAAWAARLASFVQASGARVLQPGSGDPPGTRLARDTTTLLRMLEDHPDHQAIPGRVCDWLRSRLEAVAVAVVDTAGVRLGSAGDHRPFASMSRIASTRQPQPPWLAPGGLEAGAPILSEGQLVGLLLVRWVVTQDVDPGTAPLLATAAACLSPVLRARQDRIEIGQDCGGTSPIVGRSPAITRLREAIDRAARSPFPVLVTGESGVGKELVSRAIHAGSARHRRAFCAVNCAALTEDLLEAELFGHVRGAFTGAHADRQGLFEQADGGTLFLDEVGELSQRAQAKLLRALQDGETRRVGENAARRVDARIVAATNRSLEGDVRSGRFRQDLLFRLAVVKLAVPPLRERREDIPLLAVRFWQESAGRTGSRAVLTAEALGTLATYDWPGNVRELQNVIAALAVHVPRGRVRPAHVTAALGSPAAPAAVTLNAARRAFERQHVNAALARAGGCYGRAARELGVTRQGMAKLVRRLGIDTRGADD